MSCCSITQDGEGIKCWASIEYQNFCGEDGAYVFHRRLEMLTTLQRCRSVSLHLLVASQVQFVLFLSLHLFLIDYHDQTSCVSVYDAKLYKCVATIDKLFLINTASSYLDYTRLHNIQVLSLCNTYRCWKLLYFYGLLLFLLYPPNACMLAALPDHSRITSLLSGDAF